MKVTVTKVVVLLMLGTIKLVFGLAPLALARAIKRQNNEWWIKKFIGEFGSVFFFSSPYHFNFPC
jgi:hypothetical protein